MGDLTAEIRWWGRGSPPETVAGWFDSGDCVPGSGERTDRYLDTGSASVGIKYRGGSHGLEIKSLVGEPTIEAGRAGPLPARLWVKHAIALAPEAPTIAVAKRRRLRLFDAALGELALGDDERPVDAEWPAQGCTIELSGVTRDGAEWWSVCFEAFGPLDRVTDILARTLDRLAPLPEAVVAARRASYPEWLAAGE